MIGVFLGYAPEQSLVEHGLGRLLAMLVRAMRDQGTPVVLAMPKWSVPEVSKVLAEFDVDPRDVEWLTTPGEPVVLRARRWLARRRPARRRLLARGVRAARRAARGAARWAAEEIVRLVGTSSLVVFVLAVLLAIAVPAALVWLLVEHAPPLVRVVIAALVVLALLRAPLRSALARLVRSVAPARRVLARPLREYKASLLARRLYVRLRAHEMVRLVRLVNRRDNVEAWLVPTLFWPEAAGIDAPKAVVVPDLVMIESPVHFARHTSVTTFEELRATIACADRLICYSEHVKERHLVQRFGVPRQKITVIAHAPVDLRATFRRPLYSAMPLQAAARAILRRHCEANPAAQAQLRGVDLARAPFLFYASQVRPHKNLVTLVRAFERLLRRDLVDAKLVLTGDLHAPEAADIRRYVVEHRLQYDVISLPRVPADVLSALFALARLAVCPTLFEGGLPFTFSEALSVGVPVVMSRIPVVLEHIADESLRRDMLFDPYDVDDVHARIGWALQHRERLLERQLVVYRTLARRTWQEVAAEYVRAMQLQVPVAAARDAATGVTLAT